jgi:hypothetical protein
MQQQMMQRNPMVQRPQASQPIPTRMQQPAPYNGMGMPGRTIPGTNNNGTQYGIQPGEMDPSGGMAPIGGNTGTPEWVRLLDEQRRSKKPSQQQPPEAPYGPEWMPPVANRMQQPGGNGQATTGQQGMQKYDPTPMPKPVMTETGGGFDPRAIAANPEGFAQWQRGAQAQEARMPGSTMRGQPGGVGMMTPNDPNSGMQMEKPMQVGGGGVGMSTPLDPNSGMQIGAGDIGGGMQMEKPMQVGGVGMTMAHNPNETGMTMGAFKRGGKVTAVKKYAKGGKVAKPVAYAKGGAVKASSRGDGIAQRGKTKGKIY